MEKTIWIIGNDKNEMIEAQRRINFSGSMRAVCLLTKQAVEKAIHATNRNAPSLILLDYEMDNNMDFTILSMLKQEQALAGVPLFFMAEQRTDALDEECYKRGATVVLRKPFFDTELLRIERAAWQHEVTKNYEKMLQKQANDLQTAKEIQRLNTQLQARNTLLHQIFGRYFSDRVVERILEDPEGASIGGEKKDVTIMLSDLRGFTSICETLEPDAVTDLLNFYFGEMLEVITAFHGTVIELVGDGILAVFGAPISSPGQSIDAVAAAIHMQNRMKMVNAYCDDHGYPYLEMGIGIHRGEVFIGNVGSEKMMRYNVIGKAVNQCSRIESFSVGGQVLVSQETIDRIDCPVETGNLIPVSAKGLFVPIQAYEITKIGGACPCQLETTDSDVMYPVTRQITFRLYPIEGKKILKHAISAQLMHFSKRYATVLVVSDKANACTPYTDVEILATGQEGEPIFTNVYAKITAVDHDQITLCFTHVNNSFHAFAKALLAMPH